MKQNSEDYYNLLYEAVTAQVKGAFATSDDFREFMNVLQNKMHIGAQKSVFEVTTHADFSIPKKYVKYKLSQYCLFTLKGDAPGGCGFFIYKYSDQDHYELLYLSKKAKEIYPQLAKMKSIRSFQKEIKRIGLGYMILFDTNDGTTSGAIDDVNPLQTSRAASKIINDPLDAFRSKYDALKTGKIKTPSTAVKKSAPSTVQKTKPVEKQTVKISPKETPVNKVSSVDKYIRLDNRYKISGISSSIKQKRIEDCIEYIKKIVFENLHPESVTANYEVNNGLKTGFYFNIKSMGDEYYKQTGETASITQIKEAIKKELLDEITALTYKVKPDKSTALVEISKVFSNSTTLHISVKITKNAVKEVQKSVKIYVDPDDIKAFEKNARAAKVKIKKLDDRSGNKIEATVTGDASKINDFIDDWSQYSSSYHGDDDY